MRLSERLLNLLVVVSTGLALGALGLRWANRNDAPPPLEMKVLKDWVKFGSEGPSIGGTDSPVTVVVFSDFQCPYCKQFAQTVALAQQKNPGLIRMVFRHFPLQRIHTAARGAAIASVCAHEQGRFHQLHDLLFELQDSLAVTRMDSLARRAGVADLTQFATCTARASTFAVIRRDSVTAASLGIKGTPLVLVNDVLIPWTPSAVLLDSLLEQSRR